MRRGGELLLHRERQAEPLKEIALAGQPHGAQKRGSPPQANQAEDNAIGEGQNQQHPTKNNKVMRCSPGWPRTIRGLYPSKASYSGRRAHRLIPATRAVQFKSKVFWGHSSIAPRSASPCMNTAGIRKKQNRASSSASFGGHGGAACRVRTWDLSSRARIGHRHRQLVTGSGGEYFAFERVTRISIHPQDVTNFVFCTSRWDYVWHFASPAKPIDYWKFPSRT